MTTLKEYEIRFLRSHKLCRLATASKNCMPHVTPVVYAFDRGNVIIAIDYRTRKLSNLRENTKVSLVVDDYQPNKGIMIQGECLIFEEGTEYLRLLEILFDKFEYYSKDPWGEREAPILKIIPKKSVSWGLN